MKTAILLMMAFMHLMHGRAQTYRAVKTEITVSGHTRDRDWKMVSETSQCTGIFGFTRGKLTSIQSLEFSVKVKDLKGENELMNKRAYKALKSYPYDKIFYTGKHSTVTGAGKNMYLVRTEGNLRIAGVTQAITLPVTIIVNDDGSLSCTGSKSLKMSDYRIALPEVLIKNMDIRNTVIVDFKLVFRNTFQLNNKPPPVSQTENEYDR